MSGWMEKYMVDLWTPSRMMSESVPLKDRAELLRGRVGSRGT